MKVGIGLKPGTKVDVVTEWVDQGLVDMVLVMTVEPGFGGQSFMGGMMSKVEALRKAYPTLDIEVQESLRLIDGDHDMITWTG